MAIPLYLLQGKQAAWSALSCLRAYKCQWLQGLETLEQLNGKVIEDLSNSEQGSLQEYPLSLRILAQSSGRQSLFSCLTLEPPELLPLRSGLNSRGRRQTPSSLQACSRGVACHLAGILHVMTAEQRPALYCLQGNAPQWGHSLLSYVLSDSNRAQL